MASSASGKQKQDDLRRLMKERRENLKGKEKIDSPFAKYNNVGQLLCIICNVQIKSNNLWTAHIAGKIHKENVIKKKQSSTDVQNDIISGLKRTTKQSIENVKKIKLAEEVKATSVIKESSNIALLESYSSSEEENENSAASELSVPENNKIANQSLPKDFFDQPASSVVVANNIMPSNENAAPTEAPVLKSDTLPEGFFDDPVLDAKARNIEYKDPVEEEWEKFQKTIAEESNVSKTLIEEDFQESVLEKEIMQIDEQIYQWERVKNLQSLADEVKVKVPSKDENINESDSADEDLADDDLLDWRSKGVKKL